MEYFASSSHSVSSQRILYTPSEFARTSLLYLQETGSLHALAAHTSHREHLASYLFFSVTSGSGELNYNGKTYALHSGDCVFIDCRKPYSHATSADLWTLQWCHFYGHTMPDIYKKYQERGGQPVFHPKEMEELVEVMTDLYSAAGSDSYVRDMKINEILNRLLWILMKNSWHPEHFEEAAEILTGIFEPITLPEEVIDTERKRIKAEIREEDEESSLGYFTKKIAWKNTSLERTITGKKKTLDKIKGKQLRKFQKEVLSSNNIFFYISGNYPETAVVTVTKLMENYPLTVMKKERKNLAPVPKRFFARKPKVYVKNSKKTCVCFSVDINASNYTLAEKNLLFDILFEGEFCKIHQELSEKKGYVYSYDPCFQHYNNIGQMTLTYEVLPKHLYDSVETVVEVLKSMKEGITDELSYVLPHYVDNAGFLLDDTEEFNWVRAYEGHILDVYYKDIEERTESYRRVTTERMTEICREVFRQSNILLTVKGKKKKVDTERLAEILCDALSCR